MENIEKLIINTEFFLQCHGSCSGCFLSVEERQSTSIYCHQVKSGLSNIAELYKNKKINELIIGFGRGNVLNLNEENLDKLLSIIHYVENNFNYEKIVFEVSTSLIGKLEKQKKSAEYLLSHNKNIFFNMVINSELSSSTFWSNLNSFYEHTSTIRKKWGLKEDWGDILVLNVNPMKLPDLDFLSQFTREYPSPINISIFPFNYGEKVEKKEIMEVISWSEKLWALFKDKDLNIKNYLYSLHKDDIGDGLKGLELYQKQTLNSYYFIDKNGIIVNGSLSIMGEVDKVRLLEKYSLSLNIQEAYKSMQRDLACNDCEYQKECLLSGAYLNFMANKKTIKFKSNICLSGYQKIFKLADQ